MNDKDISTIGNKLSELATHLNDPQTFFDGCRTTVNAAAMMRDALTKRLRWLYAAQKEEEYQRFAAEIQIDTDNRLHCLQLREHQVECFQRHHATF